MEEDNLLGDVSVIFDDGKQDSNTNVNEPQSATHDGDIFNEDDFKLNINDESNADTSVLNSYLDSLGFKNHSIQIGDESVDFYSLSKEEQLMALQEATRVEENTSNSDDLSDSEVDFINEIRNSGLEPSEFLDSYEQYIINKNAELIEGSKTPIDSLNNEEIYLLDLKTRIPDLTDDQARAALERELSDPDLFEKKANSLKEEYKQLEEAERQRAKQSNEENDTKLRESELLKYQSQIASAANSIDDINGISVDNDEKEEVLRSILDIDDEGETEFDKICSNPESLFKIAWFAKYGEQAFNLLYDAINNNKKDDKTGNGVIINDSTNKKNDEFVEISGKKALDLSKIFDN